MDLQIFMNTRTKKTDEGAPLWLTEALRSYYVTTQQPANPPAHFAERCKAAARLDADLDRMAKEAGARKMPASSLRRIFESLAERANANLQAILQAFEIVPADVPDEACARSMGALARRVGLPKDTAVLGLRWGLAEAAGLVAGTVTVRARETSGQQKARGQDVIAVLDEAEKTYTRPRLALKDKAIQAFLAAYERQET